MQLATYFASLKAKSCKKVEESQIPRGPIEKDRDEPLGLRHRNKNQATDFDPVFLDWIFWWYLGTVELTNRLIARQTSQDAER